jgi:hypothetical protein
MKRLVMAVAAGVGLVAGWRLLVRRSNTQVHRINQ